MKSHIVHASVVSAPDYWYAYYSKHTSRLCDSQEQLSSPWDKAANIWHKDFLRAQSRLFSVRSHCLRHFVSSSIIFRTSVFFENGFFRPFYHFFCVFRTRKNCLQKFQSFTNSVSFLNRRTWQKIAAWLSNNWSNLLNLVSRRNPACRFPTRYTLSARSI